MPIEYKEVKFGELTRIGYEYIKYRDGMDCWFLDGLLHRPEGPAITHPDGTESWYLNGSRLKPSEIKQMKHLLSCPLEELPLYINTLFKPVIEWRLKNAS